MLPLASCQHSVTSNIFHAAEEHFAGAVELNKKRKLQFESGDSGLPSPKHKFRDRIRSSCQRSQTAGSQEPEEHSHSEGIACRKELTNEFGEEESDNDSNTFVECHDTTKKLDAKGKSILQEWPSTSSNNSNDDVLKNKLNFLDGLGVKEADIEDILQFDPVYMGIEGQHHDGDSVVSESGDNGAMLSEPASEDVMLYSNDVAPNAFVLSSGSWRGGQDGRVGARKPTIDQEFEQYFSMLVLSMDSSYKSIGKKGCFH